MIFIGMQPSVFEMIQYTTSITGKLCNKQTRMLNPFKTRKLCYRKDDRAMHPIYGCPENLGTL